MDNAVISRRGGDYATIKFENYVSWEHSTPSVLSDGISALFVASIGNYAISARGMDTQPQCCSGCV